MVESSSREECVFFALLPPSLLPQSVPMLQSLCSCVQSECASCLSHRAPSSNRARSDTASAAASASASASLPHSIVRHECCCCCARCRCVAGSVGRSACTARRVDGAAVVARWRRISSRSRHANHALPAQPTAADAAATAAEAACSQGCHSH